MGTLRAIAHDAGIPVVATLHHVDFARRYADRVLGFQAGQLLVDGPAADLTDGALQQIFGDRLEADASPLPPAVGALELVPS
jgi:phosphonate transport system ATP-binding protein